MAFIGLIFWWHLELNIILGCLTIKNTNFHNHKFYHFNNFEALLWSKFIHNKMSRRTQGKATIKQCSQPLKRHPVYACLSGLFKYCLSRSRSKAASLHNESQSDYLIADYGCVVSMAGRVLIDSMATRTLSRFFSLIFFISFFFWFFDELSFIRWHLNGPGRW